MRGQSAIVEQKDLPRSAVFFWAVVSALIAAAISFFSLYHAAIDISGGALGIGVPTFSGTCLSINPASRECTQIAHATGLVWAASGAALVLIVAGVIGAIQRNPMRALSTSVVVMGFVFIASSVGVLPNSPFLGGLMLWTGGAFVFGQGSFGSDQRFMDFSFRELPNEVSNKVSIS